jgi:hypothetical protein
MIPGSANSLLLASAADDGYAIERSLRFNSSDSAYLSRTPASAGNRKTWTWAGWVKRSGLGGIQTLLRVNSPLETSIRFATVVSGSGSPADTITVYSFSNGLVWSLVTSAVFRDTAAWFHLQVTVDTTQATASNRVKIYINGVQVSAFSTATYPSLNYDTSFNTTNVHALASNPGPGEFFSGYLADIHFIDGQALDPTSFGEFDATTGVWVPKAYTGTYGTNGFQLKFADNSSNTATTLGKDTSGNGNNWTPNNLSVTAGAGNDSLVDVPTNGGQTDTGAGGEVRGNYCTLNPLDKSTSITLANGNLDFSQTTSTVRNVRGTIAFPSSGKWYFEYVPGGSAAGAPGIAAASAPLDSSLSGTMVTYQENALRNLNGSTASYGATYTAGDVIGVTYDADANSINFYKNNVAQGAITPTSGVTYFPFVSVFNATCVLNFGQRPFAYTAPSGFKALNTANLPAPLVTKPSDVMDVALYTGNNTARSITGLGFSPDFVWIKGRSGATDHALYDIVRGAQLDLVSNSTAAETTQTTGLTAFNSDGFSIGTLAKLNTNAATYAAWTWDAGSSTVTNTQGSISSQVRANASAGFSVSTFTKTANTNQTIGHGLGVAPSLVIVKTRESSGYTGWAVYHISTGSNGYLELNTTSAFNTLSTTWNNTAPTSSVFSMGTGWTATQNMVAYCFAPVAGYSSFGSYTGNGSADGPFVYTGFRPAFVLVKRSNSTGNWTILDSKRLGYNVDNRPLFPNLTSAEGTTVLSDITSNGFKVRTTDASFNTNAGTYVFAAFAEHPFQYARAR